MNSQFKREERYIVVKLKHLAAQQRAPLANFLLTNGIPKVDCLVVEADWPEYEPTWAAIERRMAGQPPVTAAEELEAVLHWRDKHAVAIKERDALQQRLTEEKTGASGIYQQLEICQKQREHLRRRLTAAEQRIAERDELLREVLELIDDGVGRSDIEWNLICKIRCAALNPNPEAESHEQP